MKKKILAGLAVGLLLGMAGTASASLIAQDLSTAGDGLLTYDSDTGLRWLDVSLTLNHSYNDVMSGFGGYTTTLGFRYATEEEVGRLFSDAGVIQEYGKHHTGSSYYQANLNLISLIDDTYSNQFGRGTYGLTGSISSITGYRGVGRVSISYNPPGGDAMQDAGIYTGALLDDSGSRQIIGSFLVKDSAPVPVPTAMLLFGTGIAGLAGSIIKRKKK